ncbi:unnamed protein product [Oikopleura dioica]|uniref:Uncharacterized protein n=1 Tax=Oikopleura dioica TaxID=34765 RepID=E4Y3A9_OIKDI|nr:unnamed protein product [Oikopleura dioica]
MMRNDRGILYRFGVEGSMRRGVPMHLQGKHLNSKIDFSTEGVEVQGPKGRPLPAIQAQQPQQAQKATHQNTQQQQQGQNLNKGQNQGQNQQVNMRSPVGVFRETENRIIRRPMRPQNLRNEQIFSLTPEIYDNEHRQINKVEQEEKTEFAEYRSMILLGLGIVGILIPLALLIKILRNKKNEKEHFVFG